MNEESLSLALTITGAGIWRWNTRTGELIFDDRFRELVGFSQGELPVGARDWIQHHPHHVFTDILSRCESCLQGETATYEGEHQFLDHRRGEPRWILTRGRVVSRDGNRNPEWFMGAVMDITDRKHTEDALRESERILSATGKIGKIGGWEHDLTTGKAFWTEALYDIIEIPHDQEPPGVKEHVSYYPPRDREVLEQAYQRAVEDSIPFDLELQVHTATRKLIWCRAQGEGVFEAGKCVAVRGTFQDITDRKQAEEALRESEERFRQIFENIGSGIAIYQAAEDGNDFIFKDINPAGARLGRKLREEHVGKSVVDVYPGVKDLGLFDVFKEVWRTGKPKHHPISLYEDERISLWVDNYVSMLPSGEVMAVYEDITARRQAEEELRKLNEELEFRVARRTAELMEANQELKSFAYSVSHDLRAPLRAITGFSEIIARRHRASLDGEGRHYFDNILEAGTRMGELIGDLLSYSRLGKDTLFKESVSLSSILEKVLSDLESRRAEVGAEIVLEEGLPVVTGVRTLLVQIFTNLLDNALSYRRSGVQHRVEIGGAVEGDRAVIRVADNGVGIAPEYHEKIFNIFQRLHTHEQHPGTGIGLAIVKKAAGLMGGSVELESEPGKGTVFRVSLPACRG